MSRKSEDLIPVLAIKAKELQKQTLAKHSIEILIYCTYRSFAEQELEYSKGRLTPGKIVTYALPGDSFHNYGLAFDCGPIKNLQVDWENTEAFTKIGEIGEGLGLRWGGKFKKPVDMPHFEMSFGFSIQELKRFYALGGIARVWTECNMRMEANYDLSRSG